MRKVIFDKYSTLLDSFDKKLPLIQESNRWFCTLETERYYTFDNAIRFFVFKGFGEIHYKDLPAQKPSFNKIEMRNLDYFLQNSKHSSVFYDEIAQIENFSNMLKYNNSFEYPKIYTQEYNILLNQLLGQNNERYTKI